MTTTPTSSFPKSFTAIASMALALFAVTSCTTQQRTFNAADHNNDHRISEREFKSHVQSHSFDYIDDNGDDVISKSEWSAAEGGYNDADGRFRRLDRDRSGGLTLQEFASFRRKHLTLNNLFGTYDANDDGYLSPRELKTDPARAR